jgi:hypothetical protein
MIAILTKEKIKDTNFGDYFLDTYKKSNKLGAIVFYQRLSLEKIFCSLISFPT